MIQSGFFNSVNGDRKYNAQFFEKFFGAFIGNGIFPNPSTNFKVESLENMTVTVKVGKGWINGYFIISDADYNLTIDTSDGVLNRIDRIVLRLNYSTREITIEKKKGTFATTASAPALQRDSEIYELALADVAVPKGTTAITQASIIDHRLNNDLCGIVHGLVNQVDTTDLYNQYQSFWHEWRSQQVNEFEQFQTDSQDAFNHQTTKNQTIFDNQTITNQREFDEWFVSIQNILDGNVAGNILRIIENHTLVKASQGVLGHVMIGEGLEIDENGVVSTNTRELNEKIDRNFYDDYQLRLALYYKGVLSQIDTSYSKAIFYDGFMNLDNLTSGAVLGDKSIIASRDVNANPYISALPALSYTGNATTSSGYTTGAFSGTSAVTLNITSNTFTYYKTFKNNWVFDKLTNVSGLMLKLTYGYNNYLNLSSGVHDIEGSVDGVNWFKIAGSFLKYNNGSWIGSNGTWNVFQNSTSDVTDKYFIFDKTYTVKYIRSAIDYGTQYEVTNQSGRYGTIYPPRFIVRPSTSDSVIFKNKSLGFDVNKVKLYMTSLEDDEGSILPTVSIDGGSNYEPMNFIESNPDSMFQGAKEILYEMNVVKASSFRLKLNFSENSQGVAVKRLGMIFE